MCDGQVKGRRTNMEGLQILVRVTVDCHCEYRPPNAKCNKSLPQRGTKAKTRLATIEREDSH